MGCSINERKVEVRKVRNLETHHKHIFMGAGKYDNQHGVGILLNKKWKQRTIDTEYINERAIAKSITVNKQRIMWKF